jgi:hypothetical protein
MLSKISWSGFIWFILILAIPYYLFVLSIYFRKEILAFMHNPSLWRRPVSEGVALSEAAPFLKPEELPVTASSDDISISVVHDLLEDLKNIFSKASNSKMVKEELVQAIRSKLKTYPHLQGSDLQEDIANHIRIEVKDKCSFELTGDDIRRLWQA